MLLRGEFQNFDFFFFCFQQKEKKERLKFLLVIKKENLKVDFEEDVEFVGCFGNEKYQINFFLVLVLYFEDGKGVKES